MLMADGQPPRNLVKFAVPFASITWSRFNGSSAGQTQNSQPSSPAQAKDRLAPLISRRMRREISRVKKGNNRWARMQRV